MIILVFACNNKNWSLVIIQLSSNCLSLSLKYWRNTYLLVEVVSIVGL